ncbi:Hpt domain-containing protein [Oleidesulfovibrio alaskensis]
MHTAVTRQVPATLHHLLPALLDEARRLLRGVTDAMSAGAFQDGADAAHSLKGAAMQYGWVDMAQAAYGLEQALIVRDRQECMRHAAVAGALLDAACEALEAR